MEVVDTLLAVAPEEGAVLLEASGLSHKILLMALGGQETAPITAQLLCVMARMAAQRIDAFRAHMARLAAALSFSADVLVAFLDACLDKVSALLYTYIYLFVRSHVCLGGVVLNRPHACH